jgi:hypothetical protein
MIDCF